MPTLDKLLERKKEVSSQVSAQTRASALGFLAISWAVLTAHDEPLKTMASHVPRLVVLAMAVMAALILAFDLLQYVAYTAVADEAIKRAEQSPDSKAATFNTDLWTYKTGSFFYRAKFWLLTAAGALLAWSFVAMAWCA